MNDENNSKKHTCRCGQTFVRHPAYEKHLSSCIVVLKDQASPAVRGAQTVTELTSQAAALRTLEDRLDMVEAQLRADFAVVLGRVKGLEQQLAGTGVPTTSTTPTNKAPADEHHVFTEIVCLTDKTVPSPLRDIQRAVFSALALIENKDVRELCAALKYEFKNMTALDANRKLACLNSRKWQDAYKYDKSYFYSQPTSVIVLFAWMLLSVGVPVASLERFFKELQNLRDQKPDKHGNVPEWGTTLLMSMARVETGGPRRLHWAGCACTFDSVALKRLFLCDLLLSFKLLSDYMAEPNYAMFKERIQAQIGENGPFHTLRAACHVDALRAVQRDEAARAKKSANELMR